MYSLNIKFNIKFNLKLVVFFILKRKYRLHPILFLVLCIKAYPPNKTCLNQFGKYCRHYAAFIFISETEVTKIYWGSL